MDAIFFGINILSPAPKPPMHFWNSFARRGARFSSEILGLSRI